LEVLDRHDELQSLVAGGKKFVLRKSVQCGCQKEGSRTIAELQALDCTGCVAWRTDAAFNLCLATKELVDYCSKNGIVLQAFAALGHSSEPKLLDDPVITTIAKRVNETPAQVLLAWANQRGTALLTISGKQWCQEP
jgi:hypothetical protein